MVRPIDKSEVLPIKGRIDATVVLNLREPDWLNDVIELAEDEHLTVPAGKAYVIRTRDGWRHASFYEDGSLRGPMVCSEGKMKSPREMYHDMEGPPRLVFTTIVTVFYLIFLFFAWPTNHEFWTSPSWVGLADIAMSHAGIFYLIFGLAYSWMLADLFRHKWESETKIIGRLKRKYGGVFYEFPWVIREQKDEK